MDEVGMLERLLRYGNRLRLQVHERRNARLIDCGSNTIVSGSVEKRARASSIVIGNDCLISGELITQTDASRIHIGNNVFIAGSTRLDCAAAITVEDDVLIAHRCLVMDSDNHSLVYRERREDLRSWRAGGRDWGVCKSAPVRIARGAWLGAGTIVLKGVTIGTGTIVGAGSTVTRDLPAWTIAAGNPARVIRDLTDDERRCD
jgi:acetyltransferase-like isoleucine patch superfamily enzyme